MNRLAAFFRVRYVQFLRWLFRDLPIQIWADEDGRVHGFKDVH